ncbi:MAG: M56 family metallopeptidase [Lachnospiraceae bacterium]|nr:M56 family metallopeptidase [Lachnospiraceae bacterium]
MLETMWVEILNMSLAASVAILAICLIRLFLKRTPRIFSYVLWTVVLFRLLCPFSIESTLSFLNALDGGAAARQGRMEYIPSDIGYQAQPQVQLAAGAFSDTVNEIVSDSLPAANVGDSVNPVQVILFVTARIWLAGLLVMVIYQLVSLLRFHKRLRGAECEEGNIYRLPGDGTPFVYGLVRPRIYLPSGLSEEERRYMLLHEQIHIRRGDQIFRFLGCAALCLHWFNPLVWLAFYLSGKDMELSCDEAVLRQLGDGVKKEYSGSLLALAAGGTDDRKFRGSPVAFGENNIKGRIQNVLHYRKTKPAVAAFAVVICAAAVAALALNPNSAEDENGFPDAEWVASLETLYGQEQAAVLASLNLEESDVVKADGTGLKNLREPVSLLETDFTQSLLYDVTSEAPTFYGTRYQYDSEDAAAIVTLAEALIKECNEQYGDPSTYPGLLNRLTNGDFADDFAKTWERGLTDQWREEWLVGEQTLCTLSVSVNGEDMGVISLEYKLYIAPNSQTFAEHVKEVEYIESEESTEDTEQEMTAESETDSDGILGYILYITDNTVAVDTAEWLTLTDTERMAELGITEDDMPGGFLIYNPDSAAESLTLAEGLTALLLDWENPYYPMESEISLEYFLMILQERAQTMGGAGEEDSASADYSQCGLFWFEVADGAVTYIEEQYLP